MSAARGGSAAAGRAGSRRGAVPTAVAPDAAAAADALDAEDEAIDAAAATAPWKAELDSILYGSSCLPCLPHMAGASATPASLYG